MAYIYKITNQVNNKLYIGKTLQTIEERWKSHVHDSKKSHLDKRPLYEAFNKYGIENFTIEVIEECTPEEASDREIYWIDYYRSYIGFDDCNGYNATLGGDSKHYANYEYILKLWNEKNSIRNIKRLTGYDVDTISKALKNYGITHDMIVKQMVEAYAKSVAQIDIHTDEIIAVYLSIADAAYALTGKRDGGHISDVCKGKRKTAYGYKWEYVEN